MFERIDLCDDIRLVLNKTGKIRVFSKHPHVPTGPKNLVYKAAQKLKDDFSLGNGVDIHISKRIPVAAGLGGGSSNAATTLLGLSRIWKLSLTKKEMVSYARQIGSDVPFFLYNSSWALGTERGDLIRTLPIKAKLWHILVVPRLKMHTYKVYEGLKLQLTKKGDNVNILTRALVKRDIKKASDFLLNDLEPKIFERAPKLKILKKRVEGLNPWGAAFSGSGPSLFGLTASREKAETLRAALIKRYQQVFVVRTL